MPTRFERRQELIEQMSPNGTFAALTASQKSQIDEQLNQEFPARRQRLVASTNQAENLVLKAQEDVEGISATTTKEHGGPDISSIQEELNRIRKQAEEVQKTAQELAKAPPKPVEDENASENVDVSSPETDTDKEDVSEEEAEEDEDELAEAEDELAEAEEELSDFTDQLDRFTISDTELRTQINTIKDRYAQRIEQMRDINRRKKKSFETLGFRIGARFTGGVGQGVFGGIISEEERQGNMRIAELESLKQQEIAAAKQAARNQNWTVFVEKVNSAKKKVEEKRAELKKLQEAQAKRNEKINEQKNQVIREQNVAILFEAGFEDAAEIQAALKENDIFMDIEDIEDTLDVLRPDDSLAGVTADLRNFKAFFPDVDITTEEGQQKFLNWQAKVFNSRRAAKDEPGDTISPDTIASRLLAVGLDTNVVDSKGRLTKGNKDKITTAGVPPSVADEINEAILEGFTLDEIRNGLAEEYGRDVGFGYLDKYMQTLQEKDLEYAQAEEYAAQFAGTDEELKSDLLKNSDLTISEINTIVAARGNTITPDQIKSIAIGTVKSFSQFGKDAREEKQLAIDYIKNIGTITIGGEEVTLTSAQREQVIQAIEDEYPEGRTAGQKLSPGGK